MIWERTAHGARRPGHTGSNPCINQFVHLFPNYLTTNCPNITHIEKIQKNLENIQSRSKIREISSQGQKSGSGIPEKFLYKIFIKSHFRGGLCYKFFLKNDSNPQKSRFFAFFMLSTFLHKKKGLIYCYLVTKWSKWLRAWLCTSPRTVFFREKTGSGKSGKNPDAKFRIFGVRFWKRTALRRVI